MGLVVVRQVCQFLGSPSGGYRMVPAPEFGTILELETKNTWPLLLMGPKANSGYQEKSHGTAVTHVKPSAQALNYNR